MANGGSSVELLINLGVNTSQSKKNIQDYIDKLKLEDLNVTLTVDGASSNNKVFDKMQKQIEQLQSKVKELNKLLENVGNSPTSGRSSRIITDLKQEQYQIRKFLQSKVGTNSFDFKMNIDTSNGDKVLKGFIAQIRDINGEIKKLDFDAGFNQLNASIKDDNLKTYSSSLENVINTLFKAKEQAKLTENQIDEFNKKIDNIKLNEVNKSGALNDLNREIKETISTTERFNKISEDLNNSIMTIGRNGVLSSQQLERFVHSIDEINAQDITLDEKIIRLQKTLKSLNSELDNKKHIDKMKQSMSDAERSIQSLEASYKKTINTYRREARQVDVSQMKNQIEALKRLLPLDFVNEAEVKAFNNEINKVKGSMSNFNAELTSANRSSITLGEALRTAFTRFPINFQVGMKLFELLETP